MVNFRAHSDSVLLCLFLPHIRTKRFVSINLKFCSCVYVACRLRGAFFLSLSVYFPFRVIAIIFQE